MSGEITAIIPVRGGSRRLPNKNILPFGESNLLIHKIRQLKDCPSVTEIVVSSDSDIMLDMARSEGVLAHKRPIEYADEKTKSFGEVVAYCAENAAHNENVMWAPCVCPLVSTELFEQAILKYKELVLQKKEYDSLVSTKPFKEYLWDEKGPINYKLGLGHVPSQHLPDWQIIINGFYLAPREDMIKWSYFFGHKPYLMQLDKMFTIDIDDKFDFITAESIYTTYSKISRGGVQPANQNNLYCSNFSVYGRIA